MIAIAIAIVSILVFEVVMAISICTWQRYKEDIEWFIYTLTSGRG